MGFDDNEYCRHGLPLTFKCGFCIWDEMDKEELNHGGEIYSEGNQASRQS